MPPTTVLRSGGDGRREFPNRMGMVFGWKILENWTAVNTPNDMKVSYLVQMIFWFANENGWFYGSSGEIFRAVTWRLTVEMGTIRAQDEMTWKHAKILVESGSTTILLFGLYAIWPWLINFLWQDSRHWIGMMDSIPSKKHVKYRALSSTCKLPFVT